MDYAISTIEKTKERCLEIIKRLSIVIEGS